MVESVNEAGYRIGASHPNCRWPEATVERARDLHDYEGKSYPAISIELGVPEATVEKWCQCASRAQTRCFDEIRRVPTPKQLAAWRANLARQRERRQWPQRADETPSSRVR